LFSLLFLQEFSPEVDISIAIEIKQYKIFLSNLSMLCSTSRIRISGDQDAAPDGGVLVENPLEMFQYWPVTAKMVVAMTVTGRRQNRRQVFIGGSRKRVAEALNNIKSFRKTSLVGARSRQRLQ
jgi:hypothetical protein